MVEIKGQDWEVKRDFIDAHDARRAGVEALRLRDAAPSYAVEFTPDEQSWNPEALTVLKVDLEAMPIRDARRYAWLICTAYDVNEAAQRVTRGDVSNEVFLNFYEPGGSSGEHRDSHTDATVAVGLIGTGNAYLWDRERGAWQQPIELQPGDALCLNSEGFVTPEERPIHEVRATLDMPRIAIANA